MSAPPPLRCDGKFLRTGTGRGFLRMVTYGRFPGGWPRDFRPDFRRLQALGCDAIRLYELPSPALLEVAMDHGLMVFAGLDWPWARDFLRDSRGLAAAESTLVEGLSAWGGHPALAGVLVANEVPPDLARWMGPARVREALEHLIRAGRQTRPDRLFAYGNFPGTEYLEPGNADFTASNIFLEDEVSFRKYLRRLHHLAGDRPVIVSEFGLDSRRNGTARQAETLAWAIRAARDEGMAGLAVYSWSDRWWNGGAEILDWDFGLTDRAGADKPALAAVAEAFREVRSTPQPKAEAVSVLVCTRNGASRIGACLDAIGRLDPPPAETIVVDDGSSDDTASVVRRHAARARLLTLPASGLSAARNAGAAAAKGAILAFTDDDCQPDPEWLGRLLRRFASGSWDALGGPNLPLPPRTASEAVVNSAPGAPAHVMLDDEQAEHLPGCNLAVRRAAFDAVGGFDPLFRTAGDDVDFCWRLSDAGHRLGFAPDAFVWHQRRASVVAYLRQQWGYGHAEALLVPKHRRRFARRGGACWQGFIYAGGPVRADRGAVIYHGLLGSAGYQPLVAGNPPSLPLDPRFDTWRARWLAACAHALQGLVRGCARRWFGLGKPRGTAPASAAPRPVAAGPRATVELELWSEPGLTRSELLAVILDSGGWQPAPPDSGWDLEHGSLRLLAATEAGDGRGRLTRVRVTSFGSDNPREAAGRIRRLAGDQWVST